MSTPAKNLFLDRMVLPAPASYRDMLTLEQFAGVVLTDSGGVQRKASWFGVPCVTLRDDGRDRSQRTCWL